MDSRLRFTFILSLIIHGVLLWLFAPRVAPVVGGVFGELFFPTRDTVRVVHVIDVEDGDLTQRAAVGRVVTPPADAAPQVLPSSPAEFPRVQSSLPLTPEERQFAVLPVRETATVPIQRDVREPGPPATAAAPVAEPAVAAHNASTVTPVGGPELVTAAVPRPVLDAPRTASPSSSASSPRPEPSLATEALSVPTVATVPTVSVPITAPEPSAASRPQAAGGELSVPVDVSLPMPPVKPGSGRTGPGETTAPAAGPQVPPMEANAATPAPPARSEVPMSGTVRDMLSPPVRPDTAAVPVPVASPAPVLAGETTNLSVQRPVTRLQALSEEAVPQPAVSPTAPSDLAATRERPIEHPLGVDVFVATGETGRSMHLNTGEPHASRPGAEEGLELAAVLDDKVRLAPRLHTFVPPAYPEHLRGSGEEGVVFVRVRVDAGGQVIDWQIANVLGDPAFADAVAAVVPRWRFTVPEVWALAGQNPPVHTVRVVVREGG